MAALGSRWLPLCLALLAFGLRTLPLTFQSLWRDETDALRFATQPFEQLLSMFRNPGQNGPLYFLGLRPWVSLAGRTEFALRFPSALAGTLAVVMVYVLVRRMLGRTTAVMAALLMALAPYLVWYGQEAKMYALLTVLVPASLLALIAAARRGRWWRWAAVYVLTSLAFYTHLVAVLIVPVQCVWLVALLPGRVLRRVVVTMLYALLLILPYLPLLAWQPAVLQAQPQTGFPFVPLPDMVEVLAVGFALGIRPSRTFLSLLPAIVLLVSAAVLPYLQDDPEKAPPGKRRSTGLLLVWLLLPPLMLYAVTTRVPMFTDRYLIWIGPPFMALLASGVVALTQIWKPLGALVLLPMLVLQLSANVTQMTVLIKSDFRSAAAYVTAHAVPGDVLVYQIPHGRYTFSYYASGDHDPEDPSWHGLDGPYTNDGVDEPTVNVWLDGQLAGARRVWLIESEVGLWDQRGLLRKWFATKGFIEDEQAYQRVELVLYNLAS